MITFLNPNAIKDASIEGIKIKDGTISSSKIAGVSTSITWSALKTLRDTSKLIPGMQYRITNYTCTTTQANTRSAGHVFDIIVTADSANTLNEVARAIKHVGDSYFRACNLNAWKIWYCLDNDTNRFIWADSTNGKGVIYRMIDEHNNDCPYDFKNIQYNGSWGYWAYTFNWICDNTDNTCVDLSVVSGVNEMGGDTYAYGNVIKPCDNGVNDINHGFSLCLNACVFLNTASYSDDTLSYGCHNNIFGNNCYNNTFGHDCYNNTFGPVCNNNTFGGGCYNNTFGSDCHNNTFGNGCYNNTFGVNCYTNIFGSNCLINTFGSYCGSNTFGNSCNYNTFGNNCNNNTFGGSCHANIFGNNCAYIKFVTATGGTTPADYYSYNKFDNGVSYVKLYNAANASYTEQVQYYHIVAGVNGTSSTYKNIRVDRGRTYDTTVSKVDGATDIVGYNLAMYALANGYAEPLG